MQTILIVEDDEIINGGIAVYLTRQGYGVTAAYTAAEAKAALAQAFSLVILDINLPDGNGLALCREIRAQSDVPVLFLTANDTEDNMIEGFEAGCDDYIAKPFSVGVLGQRVKAILRRSIAREEAPQLFSYEALTVDWKRMAVQVGDTPVKLSATEFKLLKLLIQNKGQVMTRAALLAHIWDVDENFIDENTLSVHIRRLRQKLEPDPKHPCYIQTVFGIGYTFGE